MYSVLQSNVLLTIHKITKFIIIFYYIILQDILSSDLCSNPQVRPPRFLGSVSRMNRHGNLPGYFIPVFHLTVTTIKTHRRKTQFPQGQIPF